MNIAESAEPWWVKRTDLPPLNARVSSTASLAPFSVRGVQMPPGGPPTAAPSKSSQNLPAQPPGLAAGTSAAGLSIATGASGAAPPEPDDPPPVPPEPSAPPPPPPEAVPPPPEAPPL